MTPDDFELVTWSSLWIGTEPTRFADAFNRRLSDVAPRSGNLVAESAALVVELLALTRNATDLDLLLAEARGLGARHAGRGIASADYPLVADAFVHAIRTVVGPAWTADLASAWSSFLRLVTEIMLGAARAHLFTPQPHHPPRRIP